MAATADLPKGAACAAPADPRAVRVALARRVPDTPSRWSGTPARLDQEPRRLAQTLRTNPTGHSGLVQGLDVAARDARVGRGGAAGDGRAEPIAEARSAHVAHAAGGGPRFRRYAFHPAVERGEDELEFEGEIPCPAVLAGPERCREREQQRLGGRAVLRRCARRDLAAHARHGAGEPGIRVPVPGLAADDGEQAQEEERAAGPGMGSRSQGRGAGRNGPRPCGAPRGIARVERRRSAPGDRSSPCVGYVTDISPRRPRRPDNARRSYLGSTP